MRREAIQKRALASFYTEVLSSSRANPGARFSGNGQIKTYLAGTCWGRAVALALVLKKY
jgi:hypothetical protein